MSEGIWSALAGAVGQLTALEVAANNVANASTPGYRADHVVFREYLGRAAAARGRPPPGMRSNAIGAIMTTATQGNIVQTGRELDVALRGDGYFVVKTPRGERYTRLGSFQVARDGALVTRDGDPVLGSDHKVVRVPREAGGARILADGTVEWSGGRAGELLCVSFDRKVVLEKEGSVLLRPSAPASPSPVRMSLEPGALEQSNMSAVKGMMDIVGASRGFEACERVIDAFRDADRKAAMTIAGRG